jgi:hypothetical protein
MATQIALAILRLISTAMQGGHGKSDWHQFRAFADTNEAETVAFFDCD